MTSVSGEDRSSRDEATHDQPLYRQLYLRLHDAILSGSLRPGQRLASTRTMASQMGIARNTVLQAFAQLEGEGYIEATRGSGHHVSTLLSHQRARTAAGQERTDSTPSASRSPPIRNPFSFVPASLRRPLPPVPFRINFPALDHFPIDTWGRLQTKVLREAKDYPGPGSLLGEADAQGDLSLRRAIADHVSIARGVRCSAESVVITAGAQHAIDMLLRVLTIPGDLIGVEDPCFPGSLSAARAAGCRIVPMPVDQQGVDLTPVLAPGSSPRLVIVCPSTQFPLGMTMSLPRRLALIDWARRSAAWIIEDDYDSEYRFNGKPIPSLQGMDGPKENVIYVGTFSKVLFPSLRIGFIAAPSALVEPLSAARAISGRHGSTLEQRVLARFIDDGHLARHIRKMRVLYRDRQALLVELCRSRLGGRLSLETAEAGLQTVGWLDATADDQAIADQARRYGIEVAPLSRFVILARRPPAVVLGFGGFDSEQIRSGIDRLAVVLKATGRPNVRADRPAD